MIDYIKDYRGNKMNIDHSLIKRASVKERFISLFSQKYREELIKRENTKEFFSLYPKDIMLG